MERYIEDSSDNVKKYGINECKQYYSKGIHFVLTNYKGLYKNRLAALGFILPMYDIDSYMVSLVLISFTGAGLGTEKVYQAVKRHINKFGKVQKRTFKHILGADSKNNVVGYCQLQGIYLAMKEYGMEQEFFRMKKEFTNNKIPNL